MNGKVNVKNGKNSKSKVGVIVASLIIVLAIGAFIFAFVFLFNEKDGNSSFSRSFQEMYTDYVKKDLKKDYDEMLKADSKFYPLEISDKENPRIAFVDVGLEVPAMILLSGDTKGSDVPTNESNENNSEEDSITDFNFSRNFFVSYPKGKGEVYYLAGNYLGDTEDLDFVYLYEKGPKKYDWYARITEKSGIVRLTSIRNMIDVEVNNAKASDESDYIGVENDIYESMDASREKFVVIDEVSLDFTEIDTKMKEDKVESFMKSVIKKYKSEGKLVTGKVKSKVEEATTKKK